MNKNLLYLLLCNLFLVLSLNALPEWTALVYVQGNNNLNAFAVKNFSDMTSIGSNANVNALVQWYQPNQRGVWRYKIEKGKMVLDECQPIESDGNSVDDLVHSMRWATTKYPANKYSLILWNHGIGIIDPLWGKPRPWTGGKELDFEQISIDQAMLTENPRIQIDGLTMNDAITFSNQLDFNQTTTHNRGILFNEQSKTYMDNQSLTQALQTIKKTLLKNKKIDLLGMDACLMAMVEVGYQARDYADILVASQEVELAHGWNYQALLQTLSLKSTTATQVAQTIVQSYEAFYKDKIQFYTQSAINLNHMNGIKQNIDRFVTAFRSFQPQDKNMLTDLAKNARKSSVQFSTATYVDLHTFYVEFNKQLDTITASPLRKNRAFADLKQELLAGMKIIEQSIIACTAGKNFPGAKGLSIYFPVGRIDASYPRTDFAKECLWYSFIKELTGS